MSCFLCQAFKSKNTINNIYCGSKILKARVMNILQLPKDVVKHVWTYMTRIEDIVRFASTCREIQSLAFEVPRTINVYHKIPSLIFNYIFSQDLRLLTGLQYQISRDAQLSDWRAEKLKIISTLNNLRVLEVGNYAVETHFLQDLALLIQKTTSIEELTAPFPVGSCDLRNILGSHKKLTKLIIPCAVFEGSGLEKLQQLSSLSIQIHNSTVLNEVIKLPNLTALQIHRDILLAEYDEQEAIDPFKEISQLTNLEMIDIEGTNQLFPWSVLETLPKLSAAILSGYYLTTIHLCSYDIVTRLTRLEFKDDSEDLCYTEKLSKLVNLRELRCPDIFFGHFRFEKFEHLTRLEFHPCNITNEDEIQFPSQLKCLAILGTLSVNTVLLQAVLAATSLEELSFGGGFTSKESASQISRLTNLKTLKFNQNMPTGIGKDLKPLLHLRSLAIKDLMHGDVNELKDLTQICQLTIKHIRGKLKLKEIRKNLPFIVYLDK